MRLIVALCALVFTVPANASDTLYVGFWNVENLFDTVDDPDVKLDEEFTPGAPKRWTDERLEIKCKNLARVISDMNDGKGPDVLGLSEVENRAVIEALLKQLEPLGRDYGIVHQDSPSGRGIDCALIYDKKVLKLKSQGFLHVFDGTREIVEAQLEVGGQPLWVFVNHWPSRRNPPEQRVAAGTVLRKRIDALLAKDPKTEIIVVGDLNDYPTDDSVAKALGASGDRAALKPGQLYNTTWPIHEAPGKGTYNYRGEWGVIDHVIVSGGLLDDEKLSWQAGSTEAIAHDYQMFKPGEPGARPNRTYGGNNYYGGFSDHLPVGCKLRRR